LRSRDPIYVWVCLDCNAMFSEPLKRGGRPACPRCGSYRISRVLLAW